VTGIGPGERRADRGIVALVGKVRRRLAMRLALILCVIGDAATLAWPDRLPAWASIAAPAPPEVVAELQVALARARERFEARDAAGVLAYVSDRYRSGGFTKAALGQQLVALFALYDQVRAPVRIDEVRMVEGAAWLYTTGEISGSLPLLGWVTVLSWERQPEVVRREGTAWRLYGFQD
jgi:hypothetical protein